MGDITKSLLSQGEVRGPPCIPWKILHIEQTSTPSGFHTQICANHQRPLLVLVRPPAESPNALNETVSVSEGEQWGK